MKWNVPIRYSPFYKFLLLQSGGGGIGPCALSYASDSGAARICERGQSEGAKRPSGFLSLKIRV